MPERPGTVAGGPPRRTIRQRRTSHGMSLVGLRETPKTLHIRWMEKLASCAPIKAYLTPTLWQSTPRLFLNLKPA
jgi:hypothetical protein